MQFGTIALVQAQVLAACFCIIKANINIAKKGKDHPSIFLKLVLTLQVAEKALRTPGSVDHTLRTTALKKQFGGFPGGAVVKNPPANAGDSGSSPGLKRSHMPRSN